MTKQPLKSEILDNPACRNKAAQLTLMQRNTKSSEGSVERTDGVEEPEKMDSISDDSEIDTVITKKRKVPLQVLNQ